MQPCIIDHLLTTDEDTSDFSSVSTLDNLGHPTFCFLTDSNGTHRLMLTHDLTDAQRSMRTLVTNITPTGSDDRPVALLLRVVPTYISELLYNHIVYWGIRSISTTTPTPTRGRVSPFDKTIVTVDCSSITTHDAFCIGLSLSTTLL